MNKQCWHANVSSDSYYAFKKIDRADLVQFISLCLDLRIYLSKEAFLHDMKARFWIFSGSIISSVHSYFPSYVFQHKQTLLWQSDPFEIEICSENDSSSFGWTHSKLFDLFFWVDLLCNQYISNDIFETCSNGHLDTFPRVLCSTRVCILLQPWSRIWRIRSTNEKIMPTHSNHVLRHSFSTHSLSTIQYDEYSRNSSIAEHLSMQYRTFERLETDPSRFVRRFEQSTRSTVTHLSIRGHDLLLPSDQLFLGLDLLVTNFQLLLCELDHQVNHRLETDQALMPMLGSISRRSDFTNFCQRYFLTISCGTNVDLPCSSKSSLPRWRSQSRVHCESLWRWEKTTPSTLSNAGEYERTQKKDPSIYWEVRTVKEWTGEQVRQKDSFVVRQVVDLRIILHWCMNLFKANRWNLLPWAVSDYRAIPWSILISGKITSTCHQCHTIFLHYLHIDH